MSIVCFGELLIDFIANESGVTVGQASGFEKAAGGAPANVAVGIQRLGFEASFMGQVGDDPFGHYLASVLQAEGVNIEGLVFSEAARTTLAFVSLQADGERSFVFYRHPGADMLMPVEAIAYKQLDQAQIFHYGSITLIHDISRRTTLAARDYASEQGAFISYDPNLRLALWESEAAARQGILAGLDKVNLLKISDEELEFLCGEEGIDSLWRDSLEYILLTHGAAGASLYTRDGHYQVAGYPVKAIDTTGAGDSFVAAILSGILQNRNQLDAKFADIIAYANAVGALTTQKRGAIPALPTHAEVEQFLSTQARD